MSVRELAEDHHSDRRRLARSVTAEGRRLWREVDPADLSRSWTPSVLRLMDVLTAAQLIAAQRADGYVDSVLAEQDIDAEPAGRVRPEAFAGVASDGRPLASLLMSPVIHTRRLIGRGHTRRRSMAGGAADLEMILRTQVADAGRVADGVAVAARPRVIYTRYATPPSCPRCVILAGRTYRYSQGFDRHPGCDCVMQPSTQQASEDLISDPRQAFDRGQIRGLSKADAKAIRDGADMNRVINAHRGMYTAGGRKATRALAGRRGIPGMRIRPEQIYRDATSRVDAIRLLKLHGFLV